MEIKTEELKKEWMAAIDDVEKQLRQEALRLRELLSIYVDQLDKRN